MLKAKSRLSRRTFLNRVASAILTLSILLLSSCTIIDRETRSNYYWDDDGMLVLNGKRTFIIGSYHLPKAENPYRELSANGYNYIRVTPDLKALDAAHEQQLKTWVTTGCVSEDLRNEERRRITEMVRNLKSHPALLCWEIADEPAWMWNSADRRVEPELMYETYKLIKKEDPEHLVYTNHAPTNLVSTIQRYNTSTDIIACDIYPVIPHGIIPGYAQFPDGLQGDLLNAYLSQVGEYADKMHLVSGGTKPLFMVLQGFSWEMLKKENERDNAMIQYPTYEQSRFMAYHAIVHGAAGINYWGMAYTPQPSPFMDDLNRVTRELAEMQPVLAARSVKMGISKVYHELGHSMDAGVEIVAKQVNGITYLITVNADKNPVRVSLGGLDGFSKALVLNEGRSVTLDEEDFTDEYEPFGVHIYQLE